MSEKYFNVIKTKQIFNCLKTNCFTAKDEMEAYINEYPNDYSMQCFYAGVLITIGKIDEAKFILNNIEKIINDEIIVSNLLNKKKEIKNNYFFTMLRYYIYSGQYNEFIKLYLSQSNLNLNAALMYCDKKLNLIDKNRREPNSYIFRQIVEYQEDDFLDHIHKHLAEYNDIDEPISSIFSYDFPLENMIAEIKKYIPCSMKINSGFIENTYMFKYDYCGKVKNKTVNYFKMVTFNNTNEFITMCPSDEYSEYPCFDLNYMRQDKPIIKKLSQVEKFNRKYHIQ